MQNFLFGNLIDMVESRLVRGNKDTIKKFSYINGSRSSMKCARNYNHAIKKNLFFKLQLINDLCTKVTETKTCDKKQRELFFVLIIDALRIFLLNFL